MNKSLHIVCPHCHRANRVPQARLGDAAICGRCQQALFMAEPLDLNEVQFDTHIKRSDIPLLVDFWAPWCGPCKAMAPVFFQAAAELEPAVRLIKVDTEQQQTLAARYQIRSIPTLALFHQGREVARQAGALERSRLLSWVRANLPPV